MRPFVLAAILTLGTSAPALACPPLEACVVRLPSTVRDAIARTAATPRAPAATVALAPEALALRVKPKLSTGEIEMPWIWRVLREQVYSRMPTYEQRNEVKLVLAPVIVTSPSDTVPGVGIAGDF